MPRCATSSSPARARFAPVNAPRSWPNSSLSSSDSARPAQLTATNSCARRGPARVDQPGDELLAGAGLALEDHRLRAGNDPVEPRVHLLHRRRRADDLVVGHAARVAVWCRRIVSSARSSVSVASRWACAFSTAVAACCASSSRNGRAARLEQRRDRCRASRYITPSTPAWPTSGTQATARTPSTPRLRLAGCESGSVGEGDQLDPARAADLTDQAAADLERRIVDRGAVEVLRRGELERLGAARPRTRDRRPSAGSPRAARRAALRADRSACRARAPARSSASRSSGEYDASALRRRRRAAGGARPRATPGSTAVHRSSRGPRRRTGLERRLHETCRPRGVARPVQPPGEREPGAPLHRPFLGGASDSKQGLAGRHRSGSARGRAPPRASSSRRASSRSASEARPSSASAYASSIAVCVGSFISVVLSPQSTSPC